MTKKEKQTKATLTWLTNEVTRQRMVVTILQELLKEKDLEIEKIKEDMDNLRTCIRERTNPSRTGGKSLFS
jgi:hypothetical protein